ncbi:helix-turn-helix domain-containing protein [Skermanella pratensis]|uniref:helix-turn-helix domain-containing protein n=1 Tax=Skermanella pratensis TaxID=2233999 RepID=UPI0013014537|nr:helix-turn-helix transcriptional regulator [Skermanella pratensis]
MVPPPQPNVAHDAGDLRKEAGLWIKSLRRAAGLSQRQLAQAAGVYYYTTIAQIEAGKLRIQPDRYEAFAQALGVADTQAFVKQLMSYYDPVTHKALFGDERGDEKVED